LKKQEGVLITNFWFYNLIKTVILFKFFSFISFLFLSEERRKKRTKERRKKRVQTYRQNRSHNAARGFIEQKDVCAIISTKILAHASHFRDVGWKVMFCVDFVRGLSRALTPTDFVEDFLFS